MFCYPDVTPSAVDVVNSGALPWRRRWTKGFTDIAIRNLKAGDTRREIPDPRAHGLYVVVQLSEKESFAVRYRFGGTPRKLTLQSGVSLLPE